MTSSASRPHRTRPHRSHTQRTHTHRATTAALGLSVIALTALSWAAGAPVAHAADQAESVAVDAVLRESGSLEVTETIKFAGVAPAQIVQQLETTTDLPGGQYYQTDVHDIVAKAGSTDLSAKVESKDDAQVVTIDTTAAGRNPITITYTVDGTLRRVAANGQTPAGVEFSWPVFQGLSVDAKTVTGRVQPPATITYVDCESGPAGSHQPCSTFSGGQMPDSDPQFTDGPRHAGDEVVLSFGMPESVGANAVLKHRWSLDRAFTINPTTLLASLLPLLLGGLALWAVHRRSGRDTIDPRKVTPIAEFTPVAAGESRFRVLHEVRPGHVGTVADERVDPVDVTATLIDLATRGWLRIVELPQDAHRALDWAFERREEGEGDLRAYEITLRDAVAPSDGPAATVSGIQAAVAPVIGRVQDELYEDVHQLGWFDGRPDRTRSRWAALGWVLLGLSILVLLLLAAFTPYGLLGLALVGLAVGTLVVAQEMPRRTASGGALLGGLSALASQLMTQPTNQLPAGDEYAELSRVLPYAVVLGGRERWLQALADADHDDTPDGEELDWYRAPGDWHLRDLPGAMDAFITSVQGQLFGR